MTKEEVIEKLTNGEEKIDLITLIRKFKKEGIENFVVTKKEYIETVLSMLKEKDKEIEEYKNIIATGIINTAKDELVQEKNEEIEQKDKQIDLMAVTIIQKDIGKCYCKFDEKCCKCEDGSRDIKCKDCIKQYFERKSK